MVETGISFAFGVVLGGLAVSACWGLFWLTLASVGLARGTSTWKVVRASAMAAVVPTALFAVACMAVNPARMESWSFLLGVPAVPATLVMLAMRRLPDGTRVGARLIGGAHAMIDTILGRHHECGGCEHEHHH